MITTTLVADKVTPGTVRFTEPDVAPDEKPVSIYLRKEKVEALGLPTEEVGAAVALTIVAA